MARKDVTSFNVCCGVCVCGVMPRPRLSIALPHVLCLYPYAHHASILLHVWLRPVPRSTSLSLSFTLQPHHDSAGVLLRALSAAAPGAPEVVLGLLLLAILLASAGIHPGGVQHLHPNGHVVPLLPLGARVLNHVQGVAVLPGKGALAARFGCLPPADPACPRGAGGRGLLLPGLLLGLRHRASHLSDVLAQGAPHARGAGLVHEVGVAALAPGEGGSGGDERRGRGWEVRRGLGTRSLASGMTYLQLAIVFCEDSWLMVVHTAHRTLDAPVG